MQSMEEKQRERAAALLMARFNNSSIDLSQYAAEDEAGFMREVCDEALKVPAIEREAIIVEQLEDLQSSEVSVMLGDIHPAWMVDILSQESPRVVGILLRYLPSQHSRYVLEHLPRRIKDNLPHILDAFAVPDRVQRIVRRIFERNFVRNTGSGVLDELNFENITSLSMPDLETLFRDLGVHELAIALRSMHKSALRVIYNRLEFTDSKALHARIADLRGIDGVLERDARFSILEMSFEKSKPSEMIREIGIQAFAKSLLPEHMHMIKVLKQKLPPHLAYLLLRDTDIYLPNNHPHLVALRQKEILLRVGALSQVGKIDAGWIAILPEEIRNDSRLSAESTDLILREGESGSEDEISSEKEPVIAV